TYFVSATCVVARFLTKVGLISGPLKSCNSVSEGSRAARATAFVANRLQFRNRLVNERRISEGVAGVGGDRIQIEPCVVERTRAGRDNTGLQQRLREDAIDVPFGREWRAGSWLFGSLVDG